jgi:macrolide transport system ATP-binding/permease protein
MRPLRAWLRRLAGTLASSHREREMADEFAAHLQLHVDDNVRAGMTPAEARRQAILKFGPMEAVKEQYRERGGFTIVTRVGQDLRFAVRLLRKAPAFSATAIVTIALAVGVNAAIFTVLNAAALQSLAVPDGSRLVTVTYRHDGTARRNVAGVPSMLSYAEFQVVRDQAPAFERVTAFAPFNETTLGGAEPRPVLTTLASCEYFDVLRIRAAQGRTFGAEDCHPGAPATVVISDALWHSAFAGDPAVVGRAIDLNRSSFVVIGVAPPGFAGTQLLSEDAFVPVVFQKQVSRDVSLLDNANMSWLCVIGRLRDEATLGAARANLDVVAARLTATAGQDRIVHLDAARTTLAGLPEIRTIVLAVGGVVVVAVSLVLLIACANIANLLLARAGARRKEIAVRLALGAGRARLVQQLLTESLVLAAIGGAAGCLAGTWTSAAIVRFVLGHLPPGMAPLVFDPRPDGTVAAYALALTTLTGIAFGLVPALQATRGQRLEFRESAATDRRSGRRLQNALVTVQVAVSLVLLLAAGLLARGLHRANTIDPGIAVDGVSIVSYDLRSAAYKPDAAAAFQRQVFDRLHAIPGVRTVAKTGSVPLSDQHVETRFTIPGTDRRLYLEFSQVGAEYFDAVGVPVVRGRVFNASEIASERAVIVTESTARRLWPGQDPLAQALVLDDVTRPVVGVVRDAQLSRLGQTDSPYVFLPAGPDSQDRMRMLVAAAPGAVSPRALRDAVSAIDPQLAVSVARLSDNLELWRTPSRLVSAMAGALALLALVLACTGVFGTVAYAVSRRLREIGIRVALGAAHEDVLRLIVRQGMRPVVIGILIGTAAAAAASNVLVNLLFGLSPHDPLSFVLVPAVLFAIALVACYIPARRALQVEPTLTLRSE